jgi:hypothetical protein
MCRYAIAMVGLLTIQVVLKFTTGKLWLRIAIGNIEL